MRIESVEAIPVSYPEPNDFNALRHLCLCKITADDGQVGWGESITQFPEANFAVKAIIEGMAPNLIGRDPVHTEALWRQNRDQAWWYGYGGGISSYAVAAIDIALWDLKGKAWRERPRPARRAGAREAARGRVERTKSIPEMVEAQMSRPACGQGRVWGGDARSARARDVEYVCAMREGRRGQDADDRAASRSSGVTTRAPYARHGPYELTWVEEPLGAWDDEGYANLREEDDDGSRTASAMDARRLRARSRRHLRRGRHRPGRAEGITASGVCDRVEAYRRQANAHAWSSAIVSAARVVQHARVQALRVQAAAQPDAGDLVDPVRARRRVGLPPSGPYRDRGDQEWSTAGSEKVLAA
jgi:L-alanine-DL-glutamate epimerase-like enolase superfamily enzyme